MCDPVSIGIGVLIGAGTGAAGAAITGGDVLQGALFGGLTGGIGGGLGGLASGGIASTVGSSVGNLAPGIAGALPGTIGGIATSSIVGASVLGLGTSIVGNLLMSNASEAAPDIQQSPLETFGPAAIQQAVNSGNPNVVTGSGGRKAGQVLARDIKRIKDKNAGRTPVQEINPSSFGASTGLQLSAA